MSVNKQRILAWLGFIALAVPLFSSAGDLFSPIILFVLSVVGVAAAAAGQAVEKSTGGRVVTWLAVGVGVFGAVAPLLSQQNAKWGKIAVLVAGVLAMFSKSVVGVSIPTGNSNTFQVNVLVLALVLSPMAAVKQCGTANAPKPSQVVVLARVGAFTPIGLDAVSSFIYILARYKKLTNESAVGVLKKLTIVQDKIDAAGKLVASGKFDKNDVRALLKEAGDIFKQAVADGTLGVTNPQTKAEWIAWAEVVAQGIEAGYNLADALKPLPTTIAEDEGKKIPETIVATEISEITAAALTASLKVIPIWRSTDAVALWLKMDVESKLFHDNNASRILELSELSTSGPALAAPPKKPIKK